jgi:hypothetical protein
MVGDDDAVETFSFNSGRSSSSSSRKGSSWSHVSVEQQDNHSWLDDVDDDDYVGSKEHEETRANMAALTITSPTHEESQNGSADLLLSATSTTATMPSSSSQGNLVLAPSHEDAVVASASGGEQTRGDEEDYDVTPLYQNELVSVLESATLETDSEGEDSSAGSHHQFPKLQDNAAPAALPTQEVESSFSLNEFDVAMEEPGSLSVQNDGSRLKSFKSRQAYQASRVEQDLTEKYAHPWASEQLAAEREEQVSTTNRRTIPKLPKDAPGQGAFLRGGVPMFRKNGTALLNPEERAAIAKRRGMCVRCGTKTHQVKILGRVPLTTPDVHLGICIRCDGESSSSVPPDVYSDWQARNAPPPLTNPDVHSGICINRRCNVEYVPPDVCSDWQEADNAPPRDSPMARAWGQCGGATALSSMFEPPTHLTHTEGGFEAAVALASDQNRLLLVNLQNYEIFGSHAVNRDIWGDELIQNLIGAKLIFWQESVHTREGAMYAEHFHLAHLPHVAIIHPKHRSIIWGLDGWTSEKPWTVEEIVQALTDICFDRYPEEQLSMEVEYDDDKPFSIDPMIDIMAEYQLQETAMVDDPCSDPSEWYALQMALMMQGEDQQFVDFLVNP